MLRDYPKLAEVGQSVFLQQIERIRRDDQQEQKRISSYALNSQLRNQRVTGATATYDASSGIVLVDYTVTGAVTVTLPPALSMRQRVIFVKDSGGNATANNITVDADGSETIDGLTTYVINLDYEAVKLYSDGTEWWTI